MKDAYVLKCSKVKLLFWIVLALIFASLFGTMLIWFIQDVPLEGKNIFLAVLISILTVLSVCFPIPFLKEAKWMKRRLIIDREGVKSSDFTIARSKVKECFYWMHDKPGGFASKERILVIMTNDDGEYDEKLEVFSLDRQELREMINLYAGCIKFNEEVSSLEETKARLTNSLDWSSVFLLAVAFLIFFIRCRDESLPLAENIFWWCVVGVLAAVATVGHHYYLKHWRRKNNYYHD